jgi:hypothetical protein
MKVILLLMHVAVGVILIAFDMMKTLGVVRILEMVM